MTVQLSTTVRNAMADQYETTIGTSPTLEMRSGAPPANCATADSGTLLVSMTLPSDWMGAAASGVKSLLGTWQANASATGTLGHYRIKQGVTCHEQGTVAASGADINVDNVSVASGQQVTITAKTFTQGGA